MNHKTKIVGKFTMPSLPKGQEYMCSNGCGSCDVVEAEFECRRSEDRYGDLISREVKIIPLSSCCKVDVDIWDNIIDDLVNSRIIKIKEVKDGS
tara:strand:- start:434 stop:715 length:282 start_codon:yes stop_codon:yes gene_type:complete